MEKFKVVHPFRDIQDTNKTNPNGRLYKVGDEYPATQRKVSEERIEELRGKRNKIGQVLIAKDTPKPEQTTDDENTVYSFEDKPSGNADYPWHLGGGYYELSDGSKVRGKDEAEKAEQQIVGD